MSCAGLLIFFLPRRLVTIPFVLIAPLIPPSQALTIGPFTFYMSRVLLLLLWARILIRSDYQWPRRNTIDLVILLQFFCGIFAYVTLRGTTAALVNRLGWAFDGLGVYFAIRYFLRDQQTWERVLKTLAVVCVIAALCMTVEFYTTQNPFLTLGTVYDSEVRDGRIRSQGPFGHSILAGVFGANLAVLLLTLNWMGKRKILFPIFGLTACLVMSATSSSSTPIMSGAFGFLALATWSIRNHMRALRWSILGLVCGLQLVMNNPVWAIIAKFKVFGASTAWYRYYLIDSFINRFWDWCLLGVTSTAHWGPGLWDVTNMFVRVGVDGGLGTFLLFIALLVLCYKQVGRSLDLVRRDPKTGKCLWALGATLTGHLFTFIGVNYWDQNTVTWYMLLAVIAGSAQIFGPARPIPIPQWATITPRCRLGLSSNQVETSAAKDFRLCSR